MEVDIGFKEMLYLVPTKSPCLYSQFIGRVRRQPPNIAATLNKNSIRIMDGMLIIGWINTKSNWEMGGNWETRGTKTGSDYWCQSIYDFGLSGTYEECRAFIEIKYKENRLNSWINNLKNSLMLRDSMR
jgi:hypothetical protein